MRIALVNCYSDNNRGSAALTIAAATQLRLAFGRDAQVLIVPLDHGSGGRDLRDQFRHTLAAFDGLTIAEPPFIGRMDGRDGIRVAATSLAKVERFVEESTVEAIRTSDLVVSRGGVVLHSRESNVGGTASLLTRTLGLRLAIDAGLPTVLYGAQIGPFLSPGSSRVMRHLFRNISFALPRDEISERNMFRIKTGVPSQRMPDSALVLASGRTAARRPSVSRLGFVVSSHAPGGYVDRVACSAQYLVSACERLEPSEVVLFVHNTGSHSDENISCDVAAAAARQVDTEIRIHPDPDLSPAQLMDEYAKCSLVISSRLHAVLLSIAARTPAVSISTGVTFKERAVLSEIGLGELAPIDRHSFDLLIGDLHARPDWWSKRVSDAVDRSLERLADVESVLTAVV